MCAGVQAGSDMQFVACFPECGCTFFLVWLSCPRLRYICLAQRIVRMGGPVDDDMANLIVAQLLYLDSVSPSKDITMYVNSPGGSVTAGDPHS